MSNADTTSELVSEARNAHIRRLRRLLQSTPIAHLAGRRVGLTQEERDTQVRRLRSRLHAESGRLRVALPSDRTSHS